MDDFNIWGPPKRRGKNKKPNIFGGGLDFGLAPPKKQKNPFGDGFGFGLQEGKKTRVKRTIVKSKVKKEPEKPKRTNFKADFNHLMEIQKEKCAYPKCEKLHSVRQKVHSIKDLDHKIPVKLWELKKKHGNVNMRSNLQLICPSCHQHKTAEDRKNIALYKQKHGIKTKKLKRRKTSKKPKTLKKGGLFGSETIFRPPPKRSKNNPFRF